MVYDPGLRVQGSGFGVWGSGFRVQGSGFRVQGSGFRVKGGGGVLAECVAVHEAIAEEPQQRSPVKNCGDPSRNWAKHSDSMRPVLKLYTTRPSPTISSCRSLKDKYSSSIKLLQTWIMLVMEHQHLANIGQIDGPSEYL